MSKRPDLKDIREVIVRLRETAKRLLEEGNTNMASELFEKAVKLEHAASRSNETKRT